MDYGKILAMTNMGLCLLAAIGYAMDGDFRRSFYWACAFGITASVTL